MKLSTELGEAAAATLHPAAHPAAD
jgi:hypothetical protein